MKFVKLELKCPKSVNGIGIDPQPDWSFDSLLSEIKSIEKKLEESSVFPSHFTKTKFRGCSPTKSYGRKGNFVMRVDEEDFEEDSEEEDHNGQMVVGSRFTCDEFCASDPEDFEDESPSGTRHLQLMDEVGLVEGALSGLTREHQTMVTENIRNYVSAFEAELINEKKKFTSALAQVKKDIDTRWEMDKKLDIQYQRRIAEALDNHLTAIQRDHKHKSQIEERRIKDDAAVEEAKRREKSLLDEKFRQEKMRAEAQARVEAERNMAEEAKAATLEAEKRAAKDATNKAASEKAATAAALEKEASDQFNKTDNVQQAEDLVRGAENALKIETKRHHIYKEIMDKNAALGTGSTGNLANRGSKIQRLVKTLGRTKERIRNSAQQLTQIFSDPSCPQSVSLMTFSEKIVTLCTNNNFAVFAQAHVIVLVSSQIPLVMDLILAQLNAVCIYTVPKYIRYVKTAYDSEQTYKKVIGYIEDEGQIESNDSYISRMKSYMRLYGALVQTEVQGVRNTHGLEEGWAWLARFLNAVPPNRYTAIALHEFLEVAGFALHRRYRNQFKKLLNVIHREFLETLKNRSDHTELSIVITNIESYINSNNFFVEPEGRALHDDLDSDNYAPELEHQYSAPYYNQQPNRYTYRR